MGAGLPGIKRLSVSWQGNDICVCTWKTVNVTGTFTTQPPCSVGSTKGCNAGAQGVIADDWRKRAEIIVLFDISDVCSSAVRVAARPFDLCT